MSPNLRRYGAMAVAVGLLVASAGSVHAQGFSKSVNSREALVLEMQLLNQSLPFLANHS